MNRRSFLKLTSAAAVIPFVPTVAASPVVVVAPTPAVAVHPLAAYGLTVAVTEYYRAYVFRDPTDAELRTWLTPEVPAILS